MADCVLDRQTCAELLDAALARGGEFADVYASRSTSRGIFFEEGKVKSAHVSQRCGVGVRVLCGERTGYAFCEDLDRSILLATARRAAQIASGAAGSAVPLAERVGPPSRYRVLRPASAATTTDRVALLKRMSARALAHDPRVHWVSCSIDDSEDLVTIATSDGVWITDRRPMLRTSVSVVAKDGDRRETGSDGGGGRVGLEYFERRTPEALAERAAGMAIALLGARECPAGSMPVVLAPAASGILIHEAVGHGLEADFTRIGVSAYSNLVGQQVASPLVTIIDDGTVPGDRGCINVDDEGIIPGATTLIERGKLCGYLQDRRSARLSGQAPTGNGRRDGYAHVPLPRMRVTYLAAGEDDPEDIIRSVPRGLYAARFGGGSVEISKGDFNFHVQLAYLIEDGRLGPPVRGATLIGNGPEIMRRVTRVGADLQLSDGLWTCGKDGQSCPVGQGLPTTLISEMTVGGRK